MRAKPIRMLQVKPDGRMDWYQQDVSTKNEEKTL